MKKIICVFAGITLLLSCQRHDQQVLIAFSIYCEMVANGAKPMALHYPMHRSEIEAYWSKFEETAEQYDVSLFREDNFPISLLFPASATENKSVVLIFRGDRLTQYKQWKADVNAYRGSDSRVLESLARRFGRLLGYDSPGINRLLGKNGDYRSLTTFDVQRQVTHLYYANLEEAIDFYQNVIRLPHSGTDKFQIGKDAFIHLHASSEQHPAEQPKSTAIALLTDQLPLWYIYIQEQDIPIKYTYKPKQGGPHDGFVAIDPGGYLLEFEEFKQHPENERLMARLEAAPKIACGPEGLYFFGSITWTYHKDLLKMQRFYDEVLGFPLVADQGWTKIYQSSSYGFIGLVDERRGMQDYADQKAVEVEWQVLDFQTFENYARGTWQKFQANGDSYLGPENYVYRIQPAR